MRGSGLESRPALQTPPQRLWQVTPRGLEKTMYTQDNVPPPEYRVRTVVRYVVTRYCFPYEHIARSDSEESMEVPGGSSAICEVASEQGAYEIAVALAKSEGATVQSN